LQLTAPSVMTFAPARISMNSGPS